MNGKFLRSRHVEGEAFDMTPVIDVVFLLIIFYAGLSVHRRRTVSG